ncbi:MAG: PQQ-binding-like beta-propeller repeat protein [Phycisphaerales bacterium]|nr:PQQ-binding-like beta-propeller repeat protein [Phycisphaerales bacterium]
MLVLFTVFGTFTAAAGGAITAKAVYDATGVKGGLVVHVASGDGKLTADLRANDSYLVQGLDTDPARIASTRKSLQAAGVYGAVTINEFDGKNLPYAKDMVTLLVSENLGDVKMAEVRRVLAPDGVAYISSGGKWVKTVKPRPADIDEWSHFLHDASGNAVAEDKQIGPPKRLRWAAGPKWCRSHEVPSSVNAVVTAGGRIFTIYDESVVGVTTKVPQKCKLIARDSASGVLLWKIPMQKWQPEHGTGTGNRWNVHHTIPRRLVACGDRVYITLCFPEAVVSVLDAATGKILVKALEGTKGADEMILSDGVLVVKVARKPLVGATKGFRKESLDDVVVGVDVKTGKQLWRQEDTRVVPYALAAADGKVVYHNMDELVCLDLKSGKELWRTANVMASGVGGGNTLVINRGVVLFNGRSKTPAAGEAPKKTPKVPAKQPVKKRRPRGGGVQLTALSLEKGALLWSQAGKRGLSGACTQPSDVFVTRGGIVWCGASLNGVDIQTGKVRKTLVVNKLVSPGHHARCFRAKATERYIIGPKRGAEFFDTVGDDHMRNDWLRSPCMTGATPANGLFYTPTSQCFCYPGVLVTGFLAMAPDPVDPLKPSTDANVHRGPAFGKVTDAKKASGEDWPVYRQNNKRSGSTKMEISPELAKQWEVKLASKGSPPVIVGDQIFTAEKDSHRVRCLSVKNGKGLWSFIAGGRIDSSPTISNGMAIFGCRDGWVYCLRATDGELVWRFRAAPGDQQIQSFGQIESVWPVQGSVLVQDGVVYFAAGRSSFLDGGILVYGLNAKSGKVLYTHHLDGPWPDIKKDVGRPFAMEGALPDLLVSDGKDLYMQRIKFDAKLNRIPVVRESSLGELGMGVNHLVATGGFLDDSGYDRIYWMHSKRWPGFNMGQHAPKTGQLVVFDNTTTYAVKYFYRRHQWSPRFIPGGQGYLLFADDNDNEPEFIERGKKTLNWLPEGASKDGHRRGGRGVDKGTGFIRRNPEKWQKLIPLRIRAMVLAGDRIFAAGTPDVLDPKDPLAAFEGRAGASLNVFSARDGSQIKSYKMKSEPAFDGLALAGGKLYLVTNDGKLICFGKADGK